MTMPEQPSPEHGSRETLDTSTTGLQPAPSAGSGRRWALAGAGAVLVVGVGGAAVWAATALGGGGTQPEEVVPADAYAFVKVDLDPAADQKIGALRFLSAFPETSDDIDEDTDLRRYVFEQMVEEMQGEWEDLDYATDVEPWLGQRFGVAVQPANDGEEPRPLVVVQVEDEDAARAGLERLTAGSNEPSGFTFSQGYMLIAQDEATASAAAQDAQEASLADAETFSDDLDELGEDGLLHAWVDFDAARDDLLDLAEYSAALPVPGAASALEDQLAGRVSAAVRFDGPVLDVVGQGSGLAGTYLAQGGTGAEDLPEGTLATFGWSDGGALVEQLWTRAQDAATAFGGGQDLDEQLAVFEEQYGLAVPEDFAVLLGASGAIGYGGQDADELPQVGLRTTGDADEARRVVDVLQRLAADMGGPLEIVHQPTDDGFVLASTDEYAQSLVPAGGLGSDESFEAVVPDADGAGFVLYADVQGIVDAFGDELGSEEGEELRSLGSVGLSGTSDGEGVVTFGLRVSTR